MDSVLLDTGPLIALFNIDDKQNQAVKGWLRTKHVRLLTTHAVITEVCYLWNYESDRRAFGIGPQHQLLAQQGKRLRARGQIVQRHCRIPEAAECRVLHDQHGTAPGCDR